MQWNVYSILKKFASEHHSELLLPILSFIIQKIWFLPSWTVTGFCREQCLAMPFWESKKKIRQNWACTESPVLLLKQSKASGHTGIFQCTLHILLLRMTQFCSLWYTHLQEGLASFPPQLTLCPGQLKSLFKHCQDNKTHFEKAGEKAGEASRLCAFL